MNILFRRLFISLPFFLFLFTLRVFADKLVLITDQTVAGTVLQTNAENILLLVDYGTLNYSSEIVKEIIIDRAEAERRSKANTLPDSKTIILSLNAQKWASNLKQIPATIIDKGILKNVPYISFRCGDDYEVNIYGDLDHPAGIEAGTYRKSVSIEAAKSNCVVLVRSILSQPTANAIIQKLDLTQDLKKFDGLTFEVTPPTAEDAYNGWWISVYSEQKLNSARATDEELRHITVGNGETEQGKSSAGWTHAEMALARPSKGYPTTITFADSMGQMITNAQVVRVIDGARVVWRNDTGGGIVRLAALPEDVRVKFGYDPLKAAAADEEERRRKAQIAADAAQMNANRTAQGQQMVDSTDTGDAGVSPGGGRVYVRGYTRSNGTYVAPYTRSSPRPR